MECLSGSKVSFELNSDLGSIPAFNLSLISRAPSSDTTIMINSEDSRLSSKLNPDTSRYSSCNGGPRSELTRC